MTRRRWGIRTGFDFMPARSVLQDSEKGVDDTSPDNPSGIALRCAVRWMTCRVSDTSQISVLSDTEGHGNGVRSAQ